LADVRYPTLFNLARPLEDLEELLLEEFAGESLTVHQVYRIHSVGKPYIIRNYKAVLQKMEDTGEIQVDPPRDKRRKCTMANSVTITFPYMGGA